MTEYVPSTKVERTLTPSRRKVLGLLALGAIFTTSGIWTIRSGDQEGWCAATFFGLSIVVFALQLLPGSAYLRIGPEGFTVCNLYRAQFYRWSDVDSFQITRIRFGKVVAFNFAPHVRGGERVRRLAATLAGYENVLPDTYGKSAEHLASLLNEYRRQYGKI